MVVAVAVVAAVVAVGCTKEHQCKCMTTDVEDDGFVKLLTVDGSLKCESITEMAEERPAVDSVSGNHTLERVKVHTLSCREYGNK